MGQSLAPPHCLSAASIWAAESCAGSNIHHTESYNKSPHSHASDLETEVIVTNKKLSPEQQQVVPPRTYPYYQKANYHRLKERPVSFWFTGAVENEFGYRTD
jgi:hypothetical protein